MANTVTLLNYANTFGDWVITTNALAKENNDIAANNYHKPSGTLYLDDSTLGLQVASNAAIYGLLQVIGSTSSAQISNSLNVGQVFIANTTTSMTAAGNVTIGGTANVNSAMYLKGSGTGLTVSNSVSIGANVIIGGTANIAGNMSVSNDTVFLSNVAVRRDVTANNLYANGNAFLGDSLSVYNNAYVKNLYANTSAVIPTLMVTGASFANTLQANSGVNTATISVTGTSFTNIVQSNTSVNTATLSVTGTSYTNVLQANNTVNTATLSVTGTSYTNNLQANNSVNTAILSVIGTASVTGTSYTNVLQANNTVNTATLSVTGTSYTNNLQANTNVNTPLVTATNATVSSGVITSVIQANTSVNTNSLIAVTLQANNSVNTALVNTATLSVAGPSYTNTLQANTNIVSSALTVTNAITGANIHANTGISGATLSLVNGLYVDTVQANTNIVSLGSLSVNNNAYVNNLQANTNITTGSLSATGTTYTNNLQANTNVNTNSVTANNANIRFGIIADTIQANTSLNTNSITAVTIQANNSLTVSGKLDANGATTSFFNNISASGQVAVGGSFVINGPTVYNSNAITLSANTTSGVTSYVNVNRGSSGANASIRWNEPSQYWDIRDVNNPTSYSKILTANLISDSVTTVSSSTIASSTAAKTLNDSITAVSTLYSGITTYAANKANGAVQTAFVNLSANGTSFTPSSNNDTFTITAAPANGINILNSATKTIDLGLRSVGTAGTYGSASSVPVTTTDAFGRVTAVTPTAIAIASSAVSGLAASATTDTTNAGNISSGTLPDARLTAVGTAGTYGAADRTQVITTDAKGRVSTVTNTAIAIAAAAVSGLAASATTDTTNATNISSGLLPDARLNAVGTPGTYGNTAYHPVITTDAKGRVTAVTNTAIGIAAAAVSGLAASATTDTTNAANISSGLLPDARLNAVGTAGSYGSASSVPVITTDAKGRVSAVTPTAIAIGAGSVSGLAASATTDTTNAANITSGLLPDARLNAVGTAGSYGSGSSVPVITTDAKGRVSAVTPTAIAIGAGSVSGLAASATTDTTNAGNISSGTLPDARLSNQGTAGSYGSASVVPAITTDAKGRVTAVTATTIAIPGSAVTSAVATATAATAIAGGSILQMPYQTGSSATSFVAAPTDGQVLGYTAAGGIAWATSTGSNALHALKVDDNGNLIYDIYNGAATVSNVQLKQYGINFMAANTSLIGISSGQLQATVF